MHLSNEVVLRPRFKIDIAASNKDLLLKFSTISKSQKEFIVSCVDDHVFIKIPKAKQHFWSPQLHLEILEDGEKKSILHGLFGPNPTVWTLFMFLHFLIACLFIGFGIWAYTNWTLDNAYALQLSVSLLMIVLWFALYFIGRLGKKAGKNEMHLLYNFMNKALNN